MALGKCFSGAVPESFSVVMKCIWIFVCYSMCQAVFRTLMNAAGTLYMVRAFNNEQAYIKLNSIGGLITTFGVIIFNVIFPMFYAKIIFDASGWGKLVGTIAIPLCIIGLLRFFFIPEKYHVDTAGEHVTVKDVVELLKTNKNIYPVAAVPLIVGISSNVAVGSYYFLYIVKNVEISGVIVWFAKDNLLMLAIGGIIGGCATLPCSYMSSLLIIECADCNEWRGTSRMEGTLSSITGFANKIGTALGTFVGGVLLDLAGFDGTLAVQAEPANLMIRFVYAWIPAIFAVMAGVALHFYRLDKMKKQINAELETRRAAEG